MFIDLFVGFLLFVVILASFVSVMFLVIDRGRHYGSIHIKDKIIIGSILIDKRLELNKDQL